MKTDMPPIDIGDWVYSDSPGIWRVYRVVQGVHRPRFSLQERKRINRTRIIFCKRFVDKSWKPAFIAELPIFVHPLSDDDREHLEQFIAENPRILQDFEAFQPEQLDFVLNWPLNVPDSVGRDDIHRLVHDVFTGIGEHGLTNEEILQRITVSQLAQYVSSGMSNATLQFLCKDHELRDNEYVYRDAKVFMV